MATTSGVYLLLQGTDTTLSGMQYIRELTYATDLDALRYVDCNSGVHYFYAGLSGSNSIGSLTSGYIPYAASSTTLDDSIMYQYGSGLIADNNSVVVNGDLILDPSDYTSSNGMVVKGPDNPQYQLRDGSDVTFLTMGYDRSDAGEIAFLGKNEYTFLKWDHGTSVLTFYGDSANLLIGGSEQDVYSTKWQDYGATTISGWDNFSEFDSNPNFCGNNSVKYKTIGKLVFIRYALAGEGNEEPTGFTLPYTSEDDNIFNVGTAGYNDGGTGTFAGTPVLRIEEGSDKVILSRWDDTYTVSTTDGLVYASGEYKWLCGNFWYQRQ